jgi:hypothetical protein
LCGACNTGIGHMEDDLNRLHNAIKYLKSPPARKVLAGRHIVPLDKKKRPKKKIRKPKSTGMSKYVPKSGRRERK